MGSLFWKKEGPAPDEVIEAQQRLAHFDRMTSAARATVEASEWRFSELVVATNLVGIMPDILKIPAEEAAQNLQEKGDDGQGAQPAQAAGDQGGAQGGGGQEAGGEQAPMVPVPTDKGHQLLADLIPNRRKEAREELLRLEGARRNLSQWEAARLSYRQHCRRIWPSYFK